MIHELKIDPIYFDDVISGKKKAEIRLNDRNYQVDHILHLNEFDRSINKSTGRRCAVKVTHILAGVGLQDDYVSMSFELLEKRAGDSVALMLINGDES